MRLLRDIETNGLLISMVKLVLVSGCEKQTDSMDIFGIVDNGLPKKEVNLQIIFLQYWWQLNLASSSTYLFSCLVLKLKLSISDKNHNWAR
jgi:hypothetical protein